MFWDLMANGNDRSRSLPSPSPPPLALTTSINQAFFPTPLPHPNKKKFLSHDPFFRYMYALHTLKGSL